MAPPGGGVHCRWEVVCRCCQYAFFNNNNTHLGRVVRHKPKAQCGHSIGFVDAAQYGCAHVEFDYTGAMLLHQLLQEHITAGTANLCLQQPKLSTLCSPPFLEPAGSQTLQCVFKTTQTGPVGGGGMGPPTRSQSWHDDVTSSTLSCCRMCTHAAFNFLASTPCTCATQVQAHV